MAKPFYSYILLILITLIPSNHAIFSRSISKEELGLKDEQQIQTHLTFYWHDILSGPNPTALQIANASITDTSPTSFGRLTMIDDALTEGPDATSKLVGHCQGMYLNADMNFNALVMIMNFYFVEGDHKGSTLSVLGRNPVLESVREMPVVGGTGNFRFAKGYAQARTQTFDQKTGDAVVKYDVYVSHANSPPGYTSSAPALGQVSLSNMKMASLLLIPLLYLII